MTTPYRKKLIEVALPLESINREASLRKRKAPSGYPTTLHKWWAQRPLAAARAVIFAQLVDDPSAHPDIFKTEKAQEKERQRLFRIIEDLVLWENTTNETVLQAARDEIWQSWRYACAENADNPRAKELFDRYKLPAFHDPFAGGASLPLEAQRLGLDTYASDLNPVAVLINKAMIEIPPKFAGKPPVNPDAQRDPQLFKKEWKGAQGLAEDVRYYGQWMREEADKRIGQLYPKVEVTADIANSRPDLRSYLNKKLTVVAYLWARTVKSPNPAFAKVDVPLVSTFMLSNKAGKEVYIQPVIEGGGYRFTVKMGKPKDAGAAKNGTKLARANFFCLLSNAPISGDYIKAQGSVGQMGVRLLAIVADGERGRVYLPPTESMEAVARLASPEWKPDVLISGSTQYLGVKPYGMERFAQLFTDRQLVALTTFANLIKEARGRVKQHALDAGLPEDDRSLAAGGKGATACADAVAVYLAIAISRLADYGSSLATWRPKDNAMRSSLPKQAMQMTWDFAEGSPFGGSSSGLEECIAVVAKVVAVPSGIQCGRAQQRSATRSAGEDATAWIISTDPPYYDNVPYADLSDFFYVWLRHSLKPVFPDLFATLAVPKTEELVAFAYRHEGKAGAEAFFLDGMTRAMLRLSEVAHPAFPVTIYYAFRQTENHDTAGIASTGWDTFLGAVIAAGFGITGTWPMRTESDNRQRGVGAERACFKHRPSLQAACDGRADCNSTRVCHRTQGGIARRACPPSTRQHRAGRSGPGGHRPGHGGLHPLLEGTRRPRQAALGA